MDEYPETTYYTVHQNMIKKGHLKRIKAYERIDREKEYILSEIKNNDDFVFSKLYKDLGIDHNQANRAFIRWGLDPKNIRSLVEEKRKSILANRLKEKENKAKGQIPFIVDNLSNNSPEGFTQMCKNIGVTTTLMHKLMNEQGIDSKSLVRKSMVKKKVIEQAAKRKQKKAPIDLLSIKKTPLHMKWV